jgi:hypothetical protein
VATLGDADLLDVIAQLGSSFGVSDALEGLRPSRTWESRTSLLYKLDSPDDPTGVVLKVGKAWTIEKAREVYEDLRGLETLWGNDERVQVGVPRVFGWHQDPPSVCVAFVEGEDLSQALSRREGYLSQEVEDAFGQCGAALGLFHTSELVDLSSPDAPCDEDEIRQRLERMARWFLVRSIPIRGVDLNGAVSRRYGDFAPYNLRLTADGGVCVLDQLSTRSYAPIHRDVSWFLHRIGLRIGRYDPDDRKKTLAAQDHLETVFMSGYAKTGPRPLDSPEDQALIALYRAYKTLRTSRKRFAERQFRGLGRLLLLVGHWRRRSLRAPRSGPSDRAAGSA